MTRINYNNGFLYCDVNSNISQYADLYANGDEAFRCVRLEIMEYCFNVGYEEHERDVVLSHYESLFSNWSGKWNNKA